MWQGVRKLIRRYDAYSLFHCFPYILGRAVGRHNQTRPRPGGSWTQVGSGLGTTRVVPVRAAGPLDTPT